MRAQRIGPRRLATAESVTDLDPVIRALQLALDRELADPRISWCVALSGGLDSTVLLHALAGLRRCTLQGPLRAIHVNHQLHPAAGEWAVRCGALCRRIGVPLEIRLVEVDLRSGEGPEAAARRARYAAFRQCIGPGEQLLTAHHMDDQAETILLNLLRGSGVSGLAGIPEAMPLGAGLVRRPLLGLPRARLLEYARVHCLDWVEDPANRDERMDRNYLRSIVLPALRRRWPAAAPVLARSARLCGEAAGLLVELAQRDAYRVVKRGRIELPALRRLSAARQRNLLRQLCRRELGSAPGEARLRTGLSQLLDAGSDRAPALVWPGGEIRRYRDRLYLLPPDWDVDRPAPAEPVRPGRVLELGPGHGRLRLTRVHTGGIAAELAVAGLTVRFRVGGEKIRPLGAAHHRKLKTLLQEHGVVPWMRGRLPLLYAGERLAAIADIWVAAECAAPVGQSGYRVRWDQHAAVR